MRSDPFDSVRSYWFRQKQEQGLEQEIEELICALQYIANGDKHRYQRDRLCQAIQKVVKTHKLEADDEK